MNRFGATLQTLSIPPPLSEHRPVFDQLTRAALDCAPVGLIILDHVRRVHLLTQNAADLLGMPGTCVAGLPITHVLAGSRALTPEAVRQITAALDDAGPEGREVTVTLNGAGPTRMLAVDIRSVQQSGGWVLSLADVTQTRQTQDWLLEHVSSDPVTGLWNRQHFMLMLQDSLTRTSGDQPATPCVLLIGLTGLRQTKEALGPEAGDTLLRMMGDRLAEQLAEDDMLARFGGDEFALTIARPGNRDGVAAQCARLHAVLSRPCQVDGHPVTLGVHVGVAMAPRDGSTPEALTASAGLALQASLSDAETSPRFFDPGLTERVLVRRALEADLRRALERREFELHYQPQVDICGGGVTGLEALIRWRSPQRGLVLPGSFIALAEQLGLIGAIGDWVLHEACREAVLWPDTVTVAVNASPLQFETGRLARSVADALASTGLAAGRLEVEITENLLLRDTGAVLDTLTALQAQGVRLVLDDFGTGYTSLSQLSRFRFDKIKIDRSFVSPVEISVQSNAIVRSIAALGTSLGIPTTAEGVETVAQLEQIKADGCTCVQGYFFSRPVPACEVAALIGRLR